MKVLNDTAMQQAAAPFPFAALIATLFQLKLRDRLSAASRDDGAHAWGM